MKSYETSFTTYIIKTKLEPKWNKFISVSNWDGSLISKLSDPINKYESGENVVNLFIFKIAGFDWNKVYNVTKKKIKNLRE